MQGLDCGDAVSEWLTDILKKPCRLVYHGNLPTVRNPALDIYPILKPEDTVSFIFLNAYLV